MIDDSRLVLHALGVLDPDEAAWISAELGSDPAVAARQREALRLAPEAAPFVRTPWRLPPPAGEVRRVAQLAPGGLIVGGSFEIWMPEPQLEGPWRVVVMRLGPSGWRVVAPRHESAVVFWHQLPPSKGHGRALQLLAAPPAGRQRWAVVLIPDDLIIDWSVEPGQRWLPLRRMLDEGGLPSTSVAVEVEDKS